MTSVYIPPADSSGSSCSGGCGSATSIRFQYLRDYFGAHMLSMSSHRYAYLTWIILAIVISIIAAFHHSGLADQSSFGAMWNKWAVKNRVIKIGRKRVKDGSSMNDSRNNKLLEQGKSTGRRKVFTFPSFGKLLLLATMVVVPVILTIIGADYIRPSAGVFDMKESWPNSSISIFTPGLNRRLEWGIGRYPPITTQAPSITLPYRTWWTAGGRTGAMTNALTPFIVVVALKQIPFALLSTKLLGGFAFDRLSFMHKWGGRVVWLFATAHVVLWSIQLNVDQAFGDNIWGIVFLWEKFRWGFVSYGFFTLLVLLSLRPMRADHYEVFYICHVICVIGFMVTAWLHHPPLGAWMYVTLLWWLAERITRTIKVAFINGIGFAGRRPKVAISHSHKLSVSTASSHTLHNSFLSTNRGKQPNCNEHFLEMDPHATPADCMAIDRRLTRRSDRYDAVSEVIDDYHSRQSAILLNEPDGHSLKNTLEDGSDDGQQQDGQERKAEEGEWTANHSPPESGKLCGSFDHHAQSLSQHQSRAHHPSPNRSESSMGAILSSANRLGPRPAMAADVAAVIRPGFAYAQMLPGKTIRLTLRTPNSFAWQAGQYVNLNIPSVRFWQSHPFTIASAYNAGFPSSTKFRDDDSEKGLVTRAKGEERTIVLLLRARGGFTNRLWNHVRQQRENQIRMVEESTGQQYIRGEVAKTATGVHLRAIIDGPYGSIQRVRWGIHSTVVIICGGSGVSFGMAVLEYLCSAMVGMKRVKGFKTQRVRFVWMLREYSHLQWIASALRRCIEMVPPELLQIDLFVTKIHKRAAGSMPSPSASSMGLNTMAGAEGGQWQGESYDEGYGQARFTEGDDQDEYDVDAYDLTQFDGEDNSGPSVAEAKINARVAKEGKLRRAHTRKATMKRSAKRGSKGADGAGPPMARPLSALAHQRAVHDGRSNPPLRSSDAMPERDLGLGNNYGGFEWGSGGGSGNQQLAPPSFHAPALDGFSSSHRSPSQDHISTSWSGPPTPALLSPSLTPHRMTPVDLGGFTPGEYSNSSNHGGIDSTTHLNRPRTPLYQQHQYEGGEELEPAVSNVDAPIDLDEEENADLHVVAELARPGYPKLDVILREEARQSEGRVLVSVCGPTSLGDLIRSIASKQINVGEIRKGHLNAHINVVTESYEWGG